MTKEESLKTTLEKLKKLNIKQFSSDFIATWEKSDNEIKATLLTTKLLRDLYYSGKSVKVFARPAPTGPKIN